MSIDLITSIMLLIASTIFCGLSVNSLIRTIAEHRMMKEVLVAQEQVTKLLDSVNSQTVNPSQLKFKLIQLRENMSDIQIKGSRINFLIHTLTQVEKDLD